MKSGTNNKRCVSYASLLSLFIIMAVIFTGTLSSCKKEEPSQMADTAKTMAKDFSLKALSGDTLTLSNHGDKVVVLFFFGFGCSYCKESAPGIQASLVEPYASRSDYLVIGLDVWNGSATAVESFMNSTGLSVPMLLNASAVGKEYGTTNDRLVVIDKMGYVRFKGNQAAIKDIGSVKQTVDELIMQ